MRILYLDQTAELGGAELSLFAEITNLPHHAEVILFKDGPFRAMLAQAGIKVEVLAKPGTQISVRKGSGLLSALAAAPAVARLVLKVASRARRHDMIYANSQKAFVVGAFAAALSGRPIVWRLRDVLDDAHFSAPLRRIVVALANWKASRVIANSIATGAAFVLVGGKSALVSVAYPGLDSRIFANAAKSEVDALRVELKAGKAPMIGMFGRLSAWKGQLTFVEAVANLPDVVGVIVGGPLFGEEVFEAILCARIAELGIGARIRMLGFRADIPALMGAMDVIAHCSIAPEPFGRVVVEAMLAGKPAVASSAGGVLEIIEDEVTGFLYQPGNAAALTDVLRIITLGSQRVDKIAIAGQRRARRLFTVAATVAQIEAAFLMIDGLAKH